jgi:hypothetical protein
MAVPDTVNLSEIRPFFNPCADRDFDLHQAYLPVKSHPILEKNVQVQVCDIPVQYDCASKPGAQKKTQRRYLKVIREEALVKKLEWGFPRSTKFPCTAVFTLITRTMLMRVSESVMMSWV